MVCWVGRVLFLVSVRCEDASGRDLKASVPSPPPPAAKEEQNSRLPKAAQSKCMCLSVIQRAFTWQGFYWTLDSRAPFKPQAFCHSAIYFSFNNHYSTQGKGGRFIFSTQADQAHCHHLLLANWTDLLQTRFSVKSAKKKSWDNVSPSRHPQGDQVRTAVKCTRASVNSLQRPSHAHRECGNRRESSSWAASQMVR